MEERDLNGCLSAIAEARKSARIEKILWIVCAALQAAIATYNLFTNGWQSSLLYFVIVMLSLLLAAKEYRHEEDLRMLSDAIELADHMYKKTTAFINSVNETIAEAEAEAQKKEEEQ